MFINLSRKRQLKLVANTVAVFLVLFCLWFVVDTKVQALDLGNIFNPLNSTSSNTGTSSSSLNWLFGSSATSSSNSGSSTGWVGSNSIFSASTSTGNSAWFNPFTSGSTSSSSGEYTPLSWSNGESSSSSSSGSSYNPFTYGTNSYRQSYSNFELGSGLANAYSYLTGYGGRTGLDNPFGFAPSYASWNSNSAIFTNNQPILVDPSKNTMSIQTLFSWTSMEICFT